MTARSDRDARTARTDGAKRSLGYSVASVEFERPDDAQKSLARLQALTGRDLAAFVERSFERCPNPDMGLAHFERWLNASANPITLVDHLASAPRSARFLATLFGSSHQLADVMVQNPELADLILDPALLGLPLTREKVLEEARRLLARAHSNAHRQDRLRFLKQGWYLRIAMNDLLGSWPEERVWEALSDLAAAILTALQGVVWEQLCAEKGLSGPCPVMVVGMGKLGGRELNYSSDVDLVYVLDDDELEKHATRFCERYTRALDERMGRGRLFRVDLRLRPFGGTGPILTRMKAVESYYARYAEAWEQLALLRSLPIVGPDPMAERWSRMRTEVCFRPKRGEWVVDELLAMRARLEEAQVGDDLKRGPGGIRDVEFLTQIVQVLEGASRPTIQVAPTCEALRRIRSEGVLPADDVDELLAGYTFLRQVEHRCQLVGDRQTHELPSDARDRGFLARTLGFADPISFYRAVERTRASIRRIYQKHLRPEVVKRTDPRDAVGALLGDDSQAALAWLDCLPEADRFYESLAENEGSFDRVRRIVRDAPALLPGLKLNLGLTEQILSGEIEEPVPPEARLRALRPDTETATCSAMVRSAWLSACARWVLVGDFDLGAELSRMYDVLLARWADSEASPFESFALGSFGTRDLAPTSDLDLVLLSRRDADCAISEEAAQSLLVRSQELRRSGCPIEIDLRLRPEGKRGLLVRSLEGFEDYESRDMEPWERLAMGRSRPVWGSSEASGALRRAAFGRPLSRSMLEALLEVKRRVESERVSPTHLWRDVKLGFGGLDDVDWLIGLGVWLHPETVLDEAEPDMGRRLARLAESGFLAEEEAQRLLEARRLYVELRTRLWLLECEPDIVPENPAKLSKLAQRFGLEDGNGFLLEHERLRRRVRAIYEATLARLFP